MSRSPLPIHAGRRFPIANAFPRSLYCPRSNPHPTISETQECCVAQAAVSKRGFGTTARRDLWWVEPLFIALGLSGFIVYATWAAFQGSNYYFGNYLSPFYSPELFGS